MRKAGARTLVQDPSEAAHPRLLALDGHAVMRLDEIGPAVTQLATALASGAPV